jgi:isomerase DpgB
LSRLTDVYLEIDGAASISTSLIDAVNRLCDDVEDAKKDISVLISLTGPSSVGLADAADAADEVPADLGIHTVNKWERAVRRLERLPAFTMAVVDGACQGPALDVLLATDYRLATRRSSLRMPRVAWSTWPGMALFRLANQLGTSRARQLAVLGLEVPARRAANWGLVDELVEDIVERSREVLNAYASANGKELAIRRQLLAEASSTTFEDALGPHLAACDRTLRQAETGVGIAPYPPAR